MNLLKDVTKSLEYDNEPLVKSLYENSTADEEELYKSLQNLMIFAVQRDYINIGKFIYSVKPSILEDEYIIDEVGSYIVRANSPQFGYWLYSFPKIKQSIDEAVGSGFIGESWMDGHIKLEFLKWIRAMYGDQVMTSLKGTVCKGNYKFGTMKDEASLTDVQKQEREKVTKYLIDCLEEEEEKEIEQKEEIIKRLKDWRERLKN